MCGICGMLRFDGLAASRAAVADMMDSLRHRGPDSDGLHVDGPAGLGHLRLKIIDLSPAAAQPMTNEDGSLWITFNGEIYNYRSLRATLMGAGHPFRSASDTEAILHLYEEVGDRVVEELDGMFAFALWDRRRERMLLARDRVGKKPLYYHKDDRRLLFGSEPKALLRHPGLAPEVDDRGVAAYFTYGYAPAPRSLYRDVEVVPPGHVVSYSVDGNEERRRYWDLRFPDAADVGRPDERSAEARVRALLTEAVKKRLVADVPLGAFLSGGVDSSIVVGLMSQLTSEPVRTFSIGFAGDPAFDETRYARMVSERFGTRHTEFVVEPRAIDLIETLVRHHDGPFGDASAIPTYILSGLTREHVTVALSGDGGDEVFAGYLRFQATILGERVPMAARRVGAWLASRLPDAAGYHSVGRRAQRFLRAGERPFYERFSEWTALFPRDLGALLRTEVAAAVGPLDPVAHFRPFLPGLERHTPLARLLYLNAKTYLPEDLLVKMDRSSMAHGLEVRSPFLDHALMEFCAALPDDFKVRRGRTKYLLKRAFSDLLPPAIAGRGKRGFGVPLGRWFRRDLADYVRDMLGRDAAAGAWVDLDYVARLIDEHQRGVRDHGLRLWSLLTFEVWLRLRKRGAACEAA